jgi:hypothetical protein
MPFDGRAYQAPYPPGQCYTSAPSNPRAFTMPTLIPRSLLAGLQARRSLVLENLALRHLVQVLQRGGKRPRLNNRDRGLWVILPQVWSDR